MPKLTPSVWRMVPTRKAMQYLWRSLSETGSDLLWPNLMQPMILSHILWGAIGKKYAFLFNFGHSFHGQKTSRGGASFIRNCFLNTRRSRKGSQLGQRDENFVHSIEIRRADHSNQLDVLRQSKTSQLGSKSRSSCICYLVGNYYWMISLTCLKIGRLPLDLQAPLLQFPEKTFRLIILRIDGQCRYP
ncbi:hypothetical protein CPB84DRAFT_798341 [Gymnopilus junonius]|uniref:Uncharacterized protein n=1 Tax=Gymnopilus junonius TaxID=109634 RepID=A0A9P5TNM2_GYMJU|nr:hypothetical protein CPB84DRAFT_798341 [Gymnopilus junonius]